MSDNSWIYCRTPADLDRLKCDLQRHGFFDIAPAERIISSIPAHIYARAMITGKIVIIEVDDDLLTAIRYQLAKL